VVRHAAPRLTVDTLDRMKRIVLALALVGLLGCSAPGTPSPSAPSTSPSVAPTPTTASSPSSPASPTGGPSATANPSAEPTSDLGDFICQYPYAVDGTRERAHIADVRTGRHPGYDRAVFEFERGIPALDVKVGQPPLTYDPSGLPMDVAGEDFLILILRGGTGITPNGRQTYDGLTEFTPGGDVLVEFEQAGDFEAQSEWVAGLTGPACIRVFTLTGPDRLVIDFAAQ
jgi:hypothetical protein